MWWVVLLALSSAPAHAADDESRAKELFRNGRDLYDNGRYEDAIAAWKAAYDLSERPLLLYNLSNAYERTAQFERALETLTRYRAFAAAGEGPTIDARISRLEIRAADERKEKEAADAEREAREAELEAQRQRVDDLARQQAEATAAQSSKGRGAPVFPIITTAAGGALLTAGIVTGLGVAQTRKSLRDPDICGESGICKAIAEDDLAGQRGGGLVTDLLLVSGIAATGAGTFLFIRHSQKKVQPDAAFWAAPATDGAMWGVSGAF